MAPLKDGLDRWIGIQGCATNIDFYRFSIRVLDRWIIAFNPNILYKLCFATLAGKFRES